jgi:hypothetical protein
LIWLSNVYEHALVVIHLTINNPHPNSWGAGFVENEHRSQTI